ncbi:MAG: hypothetical protein K0R36_3151 [Chryseobacterium sp.]|jgi:hypothetical protein|nr:hypothetical protein [Chryseobacterium sp.]MDF2933820.1 hypothetical protein [Chryseobacterium sp.]
MKNLKKLSRQELKSVNGGIAGCTTNITGTKPAENCPCNPHTHFNCNGVCKLIGEVCF